MNKAEIARRQLGTALALYLDDRDPVSVHTLACAGAEIAESLSEGAGGTPFRIFRTNETAREISDKEYFAIRNVYYNAFKHSRLHNGKERDDTAILAAFSDLENDERLFVSWFDYSSSGHAHPIESHVFQAWFLALHPAKLMGSDQGMALLALLSNFGPEC